MQSPSTRSLEGRLLGEGERGHEGCEPMCSVSTRNGEWTACYEKIRRPQCVYSCVACFFGCQPSLIYTEVKLAYCKEAATAADCKRMLSKENAASVQAADAQMSTWRRLIEALPDGAKKLSSSNVQTALSLGDMSLAAYTLFLGIPGEDLKRYQCKEALAHDVVLILQGVLSFSMSSPWLAHATEPAKETETDSQKGIKLMRELNEDGSVKDSACLLNEAGFFIGSWVRRKADMESGNITAAQNGKVSLKQNDFGCLS